MRFGILGVSTERGGVVFGDSFVMRVCIVAVVLVRGFVQNRRSGAWGVELVNQCKAGVFLERGPRSDGGKSARREKRTHDEPHSAFGCVHVSVLSRIVYR